jgi:4-diphosphocytidyl-2-C-methyl-D-erythritol kinase
VLIPIPQPLALHRESPEALRATAPAKVNLTLRVRGRRPDGYHEIESCLQAVALADELRLERGGAGIELSIISEVRGGSPVAAGCDNLVWRAAVAFQRRSGRAGAVRFQLTKRVPAGGGLGGGSSDAAAALVLLNELFGRPLRPAELHELAGELGADVAFFLAGGTQLARGIGSALAAVPNPPHWHFALILPPFGTSTAAVYGGWQAAAAQGAAHDERPLVPARPDQLFNDLEAPATRLHPQLAELRDRVARAGYPGVRLSGSGSSLFIAFEEQHAAARALAVLDFLRGDGVELLQTESAAAGPAHHRVTSDTKSDNRGGLP